ncbi:TIGR01620 family protein [Halomonas organivorans]|uniref:Putative membrane protein n=1 Tax=Halomonas organivorans TaxID=257772 RepID=A0A7W5G570_9GAMM|nr:TIGR01620 family protein [Halomonas organivorans]MBB3141153.1 putative membrane protein [Halomonas organivorans]
MTAPHDTDPRPGQRFSLDTAPSPDEAPDEAPAPGRRYDPDQAHHPLAATEPDSDAGEAAVTAGLAPPRRRRWGLFGLLAAGLGLGAGELALSLPASLAEGDWLGLGWALLGLGAIGLGGGALAREVWRLRRLRGHERLREALSALPEATPRQARATAETLRRRLALDDDHPHWRAFLAAREPHHDGRETQALLAHHLLAPRDREASRLISRMSGETAVMVALSPLTLVDMALVAWRHLALIDRLCRLYGLELGYAARLSLFRRVLRDMAFAGASEMASEAGMEWLSLNLAGRLSARAGQGLGVGLLGARLGLRAQRLTRPLAFDEAERPRIADLRRELWNRLRRLERREDGES